MTLPKIHPRQTIVRKAQQDIKLAIVNATRKLTTAEQLVVLSSILSDEIGGIAKYAIRAERHPNDPDKPGGLV